MSFRLLVAVTTLLLSISTSSGQSDSAFAAIRGLITDASGATVLGASVSITSEENGFTRRTESSIEGAYTFLLLPPGKYDVQISKPGFETHVVKELILTVGQAAVFDVTLNVGVQTATVEVQGITPVVDPERTQQANTLEQIAIQNLPIDRRDYLTFTLLAPGVVDSTALADNSDFRAAQTPTSGLSFHGSNGRGNSVTVDGGEANNFSGGVRGTLSQEAVQEFQINRTTYSSEFGQASGSVINIVSRSGTNTLQGSVFAFVRNEAFDARDPFATVFQNGTLIGVKPDSRRQQFGGSVGFPLVKDRTFAFASFEGLRRDEASAVSVLTDPSMFQPTPEQNAILARLPDPAASQLRTVLTSPPPTVELFRSNSGVFPFTTRDWKLSMRVDHRATRADQLMFRYSFNHVLDTNANVRALVGATRGVSTGSVDSTASAGWTHAMSGRLLNELRIQWNYSTLEVSSLEKFGPQIDILGFGFFNRDYGLPSSSIARRYEFKNNVSYSNDSHTIKAGAQVLLRGIRTRSDVFFGGRFTFGSLPGGLVSPALASTTITGLQAFNLGLAQTFHQGFGEPTVSAMLPYYGVFVQDSWKITSRLKLDLGLRYELDLRLPPMRLDTNNFAPRFGFAWDVSGDHRTVVRGGYGIYYAPIYFQIDYVVDVLGMRNGTRPIAQVFSTIQTPGPAAANNVFTTLRAQGVIGVPSPVRQITEADLRQFGMTVQHTGPLPPASVLFENSSDYVNTYSQQASLGIERGISEDISVSASYTYVRTLKIPRARDKNLLPAPVDPRLGIRVWSTPWFVDPLISQFNVYESTANAFYSGLTLEMQKRFKRGLLIAANYTLSRAVDEVVDYNSDFQANDQTNLRAERSVSSFDQRHKVVAFAYWIGPFDISLAPLFRANSGRPFNLLAGSDINQDRHSTTDRPIFAGRNTGLGPAFWTFDLRAGRRFPLTERLSIELTAECFNLFNNLNFASINNTVGNISGPFNLRGRGDRTPSEPLGFTSAFDPRRTQFGLRLRF